MNNYDEEIQAKVQKHYDFLKSLGLNVVAIFAQGSMNYGLYIQDDDYKSDVDTKAIVLPTLDDLVEGKKMVSTKYDLEGEQIDVKDIRIMADLWTKSNPSYLEILFTNYRVLNPQFIKYTKKILDMADEIVKINYPQIAKCISGMSKEKVAALEHPYPSLIDKIEKYGYDSKQLHHIIRLNQLIKDIYLNNMSFKEAIDLTRIPAFSNYLIDIKKSKLSLEEARKLSFEKDEETKNIKNNILSKYDSFNFNSETYNRLKDIISSLIKFNITKQIVRDGVDYD